jgi:HPt (histidine-containing phosphotransfer) domain-containing protein
MPKKKSAKAKRTDHRRKQAAAKAHVKNLQKTHKKLEAELKKLEKGLSAQLLAWHGP